MTGLITVLAVLAAFCISTLTAQSVGCCEDYCYAADNERPQNLHFSSKTAYELLVRGKDSLSQYVVPNCTPVKFWFLARHGTRLTSAGGIREMRALTEVRDEIVRNYLERGTQPENGALCAGDIELLQNWNFDANITDAMANMLTEQGWDELRHLAKHFQSAFPNLLGNVYSPQKYNFRYTISDRTNDSLKAFLEGLFGDQAYNDISTPLPLEDDILLKPYDMCPAFIENEDATDSEDSEVSKFARGPFYQTLLQDVSQRLGFNLTLTPGQIDTIYDACRYEQAWDLNRPSAWCTVFTQSQINILEYAEDLKYFNDVGYANPATSNVACAAVSDMLQFFETDELPDVTAYTAHSASIQLFLTAMGAGKDAEMLRADNYEQMNLRKYRSSENTPFAANIAAIKYDCPNDSERTKVKFILNQKPMDLGFCNEGLCNWSDLKRIYAHFDGADCAKMFCSGVSKIYISVVVLVVLSVISLVI